MVGHAGDVAAGMLVVETAVHPGTIVAGPGPY